MEHLKQQAVIDLNGPWSFAYTLERPVPAARTASDLERAGLKLYPCKVPGNLELDLQAAGITQGEPFYGMNIAKLFCYERAHVWYTRRFKASDLPGTDAALTFEGLDCLTEVYLNGELLGTTDSMLVEWKFALAGRLKGDNELLVHILPVYEEAKKYDYPTSLAAGAANMEHVYIRKAAHMYGWDIMPRAVSAGIWRPARLEFRPVERLESVYLETQSIAADHSRANLALHIQAHTAMFAGGDRYEVEITGVCGDARFSERRQILFDVASINLAVAAPKLWWPRGRGEANLYQCEVRLLKNGQELDKVAFRHGIRTVRLERTSVTDLYGNGEFCFYVNGEHVFVLGTNWVPLDAYHSRDVERVARAIKMAEDIGCNAFRCWGGNVYESDLFFELCDEKGFMVWQDFAMACAIYPQDQAFCDKLAAETRKAVRRLRQHPSIILWAGDNECDQAYGWGGRSKDPNTNVLTRHVLPKVLQDEDGSRPYIPSSPYIDAVAYKGGGQYLPEDHLWGPRDNFKSDFYKNSVCHFASEIGYHGCNSPTSIKKFISPDKVWPYQNNEEWLLHATSPVPGYDLYDYRIELMAKQVRELFGTVPDNLPEYALASQISQAEGKKFFVELFRSAKWRRTGLIWWNLIDGWPQLSDAIVDYYYEEKLAYSFIKRSQAPLCLVMKEPANWHQELVACNDTRQDLKLRYTVQDLTTDAVVAQGEAVSRADSVTVLARVPFTMGTKKFYLLKWESALGEGKSHYLAGFPPFDLKQYVAWLEKAGFLTKEWRGARGF